MQCKIKSCYLIVFLSNRAYIILIRILTYTQLLVWYIIKNLKVYYKNQSHKHSQARYIQHTCLSLHVSNSQGAKLATLTLILITIKLLLPRTVAFNVDAASCFLSSAARQSITYMLFLLHHGLMLSVTLESHEFARVFLFIQNSMIRKNLRTRRVLHVLLKLFVRIFIHRNLVKIICQRLTKFKSISQNNGQINAWNTLIESLNLDLETVKGAESSQLHNVKNDSVLKISWPFFLQHQCISLHISSTNTTLHFIVNE